MADSCDREAVVTADSRLVWDPRGEEGGEGGGGGVGVGGSQHPHGKGANADAQQLTQSSFMYAWPIKTAPCH